MPQTVVPFDLAPGERLLWSGAPRRGLTLRARDAYVSSLAFGLFWTGGSVLFAAVSLSDPRGALSGPSLISVAFALLGLHSTVWPLGRGAWRRAHTRYALTTERVVVTVGGRAAPTVRALELRDLPWATLTKVRADGSGTVVFGWTRVAPSLLVQPRQRGHGRYGEPPPAPIAELELIPDARRVYGLVVDAQRALRPAPPYETPQPTGAPE